MRRIFASNIYVVSSLPGTYQHFTIFICEWGKQISKIGGGPTVRRRNFRHCASSFRNSPTYILSDQLQNT